MRLSIFIKTLIFLIILLFVDYQLVAQSQGAPESMNYQAVIRDGSGSIVASQSVGIRIDILQGSASGTSVYEETFTTTTNAYGSIAIQIGTGTVVSGTFNTIDWGANSYYVETAVDISGGTNFTTISTTQLMSVPYALYAKNAGLDSATVQAMINASGSNGTSAGSGVMNSISFPDGFNNVIPVNMGFTTNPTNYNTYTVPSGKNLYVSHFFSNGPDYDSIFINSLPIASMNTNSGGLINFGYGNSGYSFNLIENPLILKSGDSLKYRYSFSGFLADAIIEPITVSVGSVNSQYSVPAGKILVILNIFNNGVSVSVNGETLTVKNLNSLVNSSSPNFSKSLGLPLFFNAGDIISHNSYSSTIKVTLNGYLVDENYFNSNSSSNSSSSSGSDANTLIYTSNGF